MIFCFVLRRVNVFILVVWNIGGNKDDFGESCGAFVCYCFRF